MTSSQPELVLREAARFARHFEAILVCAHVDRSSYVVAENGDGSVVSRPIDPDQPDWEPAVFDVQLAAHIRTVAGDQQVQVEVRELAGDPAVALSRLAEVLKAELIVVGSRRRRLRSSLADYFGGSVAAHLAHRQSRPVVVIPRPTAGATAEVPWQAGDP